MPRRYALMLALAFTFALSTVLPRVALSQTTPDGMGLALVSAGHSKVRLTVTAGASGAPAGFEVCWMTSAQFATLGGVWPPPWVAGEGWVDYVGIGTTNTWGAASVDFKLAAGQSLDVEIGDTFDESGVTGTINGQLVDGTDYVFCAYAVGVPGGSAGPLSVTLDKPTSQEGRHCTFSFGYWKKNPGAWPVSSLMLGNVSYTAAQLQLILAKAAKGNGLITLAHQLIAAKLNVANGAISGSIDAAIVAADALIGNLVVPPIGTDTLAPSAVCTVTQDLDDFDNDEDDHDHCGTTPSHETTWGGLKTLYR